jgi:Mg2+-importing ATPase
MKGVYASFMISSLLRTMGIVPGGLGTFEATSVLTLRMIGVAIPVALSATLLFRGLTFWLPMLPGLWLSKNIALDRRERPRAEALRPSARSGRPEYAEGRTSEGTT